MLLLRCLSAATKSCVRTQSESTEYILFLKDITGDPIHAKGRTLYRTINPSGRYEVQGQAVKSYAETSVPGQPTTLAELVSLTGTWQSIISTRLSLIAW
jgi:hypothetical protein